jgi:hypothetical protein
LEVIKDFFAFEAQALPDGWLHAIVFYGILSQLSACCIALEGGAMLDEVSKFPLAANNSTPSSGR